MVELWADLPIGRVVYLDGAGAAALELTLIPLPDRAPAVVTYRPRSAPSRSAVVASLLDELEAIALGLFPAWLPEAEHVQGRGGAGIAAARALAMRLGSVSAHFGPFLADLAERALVSGTPSGGRFSPEVRAAGLIRVIAASFDRSAVGLLVRVPPGLDSDAELSLIGGCEWVAQRGRLGVWLTGSPLASGDRVATVAVTVPAPLAELEREVGYRPATAEPEVLLPPVWCPPIPGRPHPASHAEKLLESALAAVPWAAGRAWNQTHQSQVLTNPIRLDLVWRTERCVVEVDGPEHRQRLHYEADRRRDVQLQIDGYAVLRFTNEQVIGDCAVVVAQIHQFLTRQRRTVPEGTSYARLR